MTTAELVPPEGSAPVCGPDKSGPRENAPACEKGKRTHVCTHTGCARSYRSAAKLREHEHSHTGARPHVCPHDGCPGAYRRRAHLARHVASVHERVFAHSCDVCAKCYAHAHHLRRHKLAAHERALACDVCGAVFGRRVDVRRHASTEHGAPATVRARKKHTCDCGVTSDTWTDHVAHRQSSCPMHAATRIARSARRRARRHACTLCDRTYATAYGAREHERLAHGTPEQRRCHVCAQCSASFCHRKTLVRHVARAHPTGSPVRPERIAGIPPTDSAL